jgi:hypothetical protein
MARLVCRWLFLTLGNKGGFMNMDVSKEQYERLIKLVYLGNWMINAVREDADQIGEYNELEQHIYSFAKGMGLEKYVAFDEKTKRFSANWSEATAPDMERYIEEYNDENFWHELIHRLAERDLAAQYGEETLLAMPLEQRLEKQEVVAEKYAHEFEEHGITRLAVPQ